MTTLFVEPFLNAINIEQKADTVFAESYIKSYSPKKLAQLGLAITNLVITSGRTGLGGKSIIDFELDSAVKNGNDIIPGSIRVGDIVKVLKMGNTNEIVKKQKAISNSSNKSVTSDGEVSTGSIDGVVIKINANGISVTIEDSNFDENTLYSDSSKFWLVKTANSVTYKRMISTMNKLKEMEDKNEIIQMLLGESKFVTKPNSNSKPIKYFNNDLNESQKNAISFAINKSPITIIHGPPGTGKTYTLIELINQLTFNHKERVLVCGPSNISVDTILERLSGTFDMNKRKSRPEQLIRIGHPARLLPGNLRHSLDILSKSGDLDGRKILNDIEKDISSTILKTKKMQKLW
jgi:DNA polymerase alpha-associated DNA helicase A